MSSGTSDYVSDREIGALPREKEIVVEERKEIEMLDEFEEPSSSTYSKFKTQNEIDPDLIDKYAPKKPILDELDDIVEFGTIDKYIEDNSVYFAMVQPVNPQQIYDLDNIVALKSKEVIGFILDLVGHITMP